MDEQKVKQMDDGWMDGYGLDGWMNRKLNRWMDG
jgi:hypothetical protein